MQKMNAIARAADAAYDIDDTRLNAYAALAMELLTEVPALVQTFGDKGATKQALMPAWAARWGVKTVAALAPNGKPRADGRRALPNTTKGDSCSQSLDYMVARLKEVAGVTPKQAADKTPAKPVKVPRALATEIAGLIEVYGKQVVRAALARA